MKKTDNKVSRDIAISEIRTFLSFFKRKKEFTDDQIEEDYPDVVEAVQLGLLVFNDGKNPILTLESPVKNEDGEVVLKELTFRTRIKPTTKANLASGIDLRKDAAKYSLNIVAYVIDQPKNMLDKFEPFDYDVIQQLASVFS